jgi:hypothetical protein
MLVVLLLVGRNDGMWKYTLISFELRWRVEELVINMKI